MNRRTFIEAAIALSLVPATARAGNPRLVELEKEIRERYGTDADKVMATAQTACREAIAEHPDLSRDSEEDLEFLTDVALERALEKLQVLGIGLR